MVYQQINERNVKENKKNFLKNTAKKKRKTHKRQTTAKF